MVVVDDEIQALLRDRFLKEDFKNIKIEGIDADKAYIAEIVKRSRPNGIILDVGAGTAYFTIEIAKSTPSIEIVALDLSSASIKIAKRNISQLKNIANIHLLRADGRYLPFKNEVFWLVTSRLAPHSIKEAYRVLKKNGWYIFRACGVYNCWKEVHEIFGKRALPFAAAEWWETSFGRLERLKQCGFREVYEMFFLVKRYYTSEQVVKELRFNPIVKAFDMEKDMPKVRELEERYKTKDGIRITGDPLILLGKK